MTRWRYRSVATGRVDGVSRFQAWLDVTTFSHNQSLRAEVDVLFLKPISCHIIYFFPHERSLHHMLVTISSTQVPPSPSVSTFAPRGLGGAHMTRPYALACTRTSCHWTTSQATRSRWPRSWGRGGCLSSLPALRPLVRNRWHPTAPGVACCVDGRALGGTVAPCYEYKYVLVFFAPPSGEQQRKQGPKQGRRGAAVVLPQHRLSWYVEAAAQSGRLGT